MGSRDVPDDRLVESFVYRVVGHDVGAGVQVVEERRGPRGGRLDAELALCGGGGCIVALCCRGGKTPKVWLYCVVRVVSE